MAKLPRSKKSTKKDSPAKAPPKKRAVRTVIPPAPTESCCDVCDGLPTGTWAIMWRDASGAWQCLPGPTEPGSDKILRADSNGPYWGNP